jgi:type IV pilus assembly protein PilO
MAANILVAVLVLGLGIYFVTLEQLNGLNKVEEEEKKLKTEFESKQKKAANLNDYQDQLTQIEADLYEMIRQMPTQEEVASLLTDISQAGLSSGLEFRLFKPSPAVGKDFYSELPINIEVLGRYDQLGLFVSSLAALPRIVTLHDVSIVPQDSKGKKEAIGAGIMLMKATLKTYNESVVKAPEKPGKKGAKAAPKPPAVKK